MEKLNRGNRKPFACKCMQQFVLFCFEIYTRDLESRNRSLTCVLNFPTEVTQHLISSSLLHRDIQYLPDCTLPFRDTHFRIGVHHRLHRDDGLRFGRSDRSGCRRRGQDGAVLLSAVQCLVEFFGESRHFGQSLGDGLDGDLVVARRIAALF
jgi:hypothetical protein